jgi:Family of unknown function (DUF6074)
MAEIVPFPLVRRRDFVRRNAARIAAATHPTAEKLLQHALQVQGDTMARRGIDPALITEQMRSLETAIRCELWRLTLSEGGAA